MNGCERCGEALPDRQRLCVPCFTVVYGPPPSSEPVWEVEGKVSKARARRLAAEQKNGRTHTIGDGWQQRPGVTTFDRGGNGYGFR